MKILDSSFVDTLIANPLQKIINFQFSGTQIIYSSRRIWINFHIPDANK